MGKKDVLWEEIESQPEVLERVLDRLSDLDEQFMQTIQTHRNLYLIGCGSSYHAGLIAQFTYNTLSGKQAVCATSSDIFIHPQSYITAKAEEDVFFLISRTGETTETLQAMDAIKKHKGYTVAITAFPDSTLSKGCDHSVALAEAQELSITATRSVSAFTTVLLGLCCALTGRAEIFRSTFCAHRILSTKFATYSDTISSIVHKNRIERFVFLGSGPFFGVAKEAELKVKEMSLTNSESYPALEYRHGHQSLLNQRSLVVLYASDEGFDYEMKAVADLRNTGAQVLAVLVKSRSENRDHACNSVFLIENEMENLSKSVLYQVFGQLIGYHQAVKKKIDPSKPPYLDFCVTLS